MRESNRESETGSSVADHKPPLPNTNDEPAPRVALRSGLDSERHSGVSGALLVAATNSVAEVAAAASENVAGPPADKESAPHTLVCSVCGKTFRGHRWEGLWSNFHRHELVHTGERPHRCQHCGQGFTTSTNLKRHVAVMHAEIPVSPAAALGFLDASATPAAQFPPATSPVSSGPGGIASGLPRVDGLSVPVRRRTLTTEFECDLCCALLSSASKLRRHQSLHCPFRENAHSIDAEGVPTRGGRRRRCRDSTAPTASDEGSSRTPSVVATPASGLVVATFPDAVFGFDDGGDAVTAAKRQGSAKRRRVDTPLSARLLTPNTVSGVEVGTVPVRLGDLCGARGLSAPVASLRCPHEGCLCAFASARGLAAHVARVHAKEDDAESEDDKRARAR